MTQRCLLGSAAPATTRLPLALEYSSQSVLSSDICKIASNNILIHDTLLSAHSPVQPATTPINKAKNRYFAQTPRECYAAFVGYTAVSYTDTAVSTARGRYVLSTIPRFWGRGEKNTI